MPVTIDRPPNETCRHVKEILSDLIGHLHEDVTRTSDSRARALFETTAEVLIGLKTAYEHFEVGIEPGFESPASESRGPSSAADTGSSETAAGTANPANLGEA